eukprot:gene78-104_t
MQGAGLFFEQFLKGPFKQGFGTVVGVVLAVVLALDTHVRQAQVVAFDHAIAAD